MFDCNGSSPVDIEPLKRGVVHWQRNHAIRKDPNRRMKLHKCHAKARLSKNDLHAKGGVESSHLGFGTRIFVQAFPIAIKKPTSPRNISLELSAYQPPQCLDIISVYLLQS
jgi:hypothetical protein